MTLNSNLPSARITGVCRHTQFWTFFIYLFFETASHYSVVNEFHGWPVTCYVGQVGLKFTSYLPVSACCVLGLKVWSATPVLNSFIYFIIFGKGASCFSSNKNFCLIYFLLIFISVHLMWIAPFIWIFLSFLGRGWGSNFHCSTDYLQMLCTQASPELNLLPHLWHCAWNCFYWGRFLQCSPGWPWMRGSLSLLSAELLCPASFEPLLHDTQCMLSYLQNM